jgi:hypothetical protein
MADYLGIAELRGFARVTTVHELESAIAILPRDRRLAAIRDKALILTNRQTQEVAILRPGPNGSWDVECFAVGGGSA